MGKFKVKDWHVAFANDIAAGIRQGTAYKKYFDPKDKLSGADGKASLLVRRPEIKALINKARELRNQAIMKTQGQNLPEEFLTQALTLEQLDAFHYSVVMGKVETEEIVPVHTITKDKNGKEVSRTTSFHRVKRKPNVRERQASVDALYKRFGSYAPAKLMGAFKVSSEEDGEEVVERFVILANGEKLPL